MRAQNDPARAVRVGRIQDKTRWTKAVGEAATVVYGDCTGEIGQSRRNGTVGHEKYRAVFNATLGCDRAVKRNRESANKT